MRRTIVNHFLLLIALFAPAFLQAQDAPVTNPYLVRMQLMVASPPVSEYRHYTTDDCVLVYQDGRFRREHHTLYAAEMSDSEPGAKVIEKGTEKTQVFEGRLTDAEFASLRALLDDQELRQVPSTPPTAGPYPIRDEILSLSINRTDGRQRLMLLNRASREPYYKALGPILKWFNHIPKHQAKKLNPDDGNRCTPMP